VIGSEYINKRVAEMLAKLNVEFTKSRPRHCNDNALAECKNGHIIRKQFGHGHIPQHYATQMNEFNRRYLNPHTDVTSTPTSTITDPASSRKPSPIAKEKSEKYTLTKT
jgi:transposase InsO family protein